MSSLTHIWVDSNFLSELSRNLARWVLPQCVNASSRKNLGNDLESRVKTQVTDLISFDFNQIRVQKRFSFVR